MLILILLIMLVNYTADREKFLFAYRFNIANLPVNILDVLVALAGLMVLTRLSRRNYPGETTHAGLKWSIGLLIAACFTGAIGGFRHHVELREIADFTRNVATMALCIFIGYFSISTLQGARRAAYILLISSASSALFVMLFMRDSIDNLQTTDASLATLRSVDRGGDYGIVMATFLTFSVVAGFKFFPKIVGVFLFALCGAAMFALPHRSVWLAGAVTIFFSTLILPKVGFSRRVGATSLLSLMLISVVLGSVVAYAKLSGRNMGEYFGKRLESMLPGTEVAKENKPWETRLPGATRELQIWMGSPLIGGGFGVQMATERQTGDNAGEGYRHNVWTAALAEGGLPLFLGYLLTCLFCLVIGNRLVAERMDQATVMMGAVAALHGFMSIVLGAATMLFNQQRPAIALGLICGLLLRTRDMQLAVARSYDGYLEAEPAGFLLPQSEQYA